MMMAIKGNFRLAVLVLGLALYTSAQTTPPAEPTPAPAPAFGQNAPVLNPDNPPVTGLDEPTLDLRVANRSFFSPAIQVSESADTNGGNQLGASSVESVSRILGAFDLQKFWPKSDLFLEYLGGGAFYSSPFNVKQLQAFGLEYVTRWRTGQVTLRDAFSYVPDGSFQLGTYGGVPGFGLTTGGMGTSASGGLPGASSNASFGSIGDIPRLSNMAIVDAVQAINPRSAVTVAGGFANAHFDDPTHTLINSDQVTVEGGYSHLISRHDQLGAIYAYQDFQFPQASGGQISTDTFNIRWSHVITGRLSLIAGVGPQYTDLQLGGIAKHWSASGRGQLRYKWAHSSLVATYEKFTSAGSGFFAGADTQAARLAYRRPLARTWEMYADLGYSRNKRLQAVGLVGVPATVYNEGSAGVVLRKHYGRSYDFFAAYLFSEVSFNTPVCIVGSCGKVDNRSIGSIGVEWHPAPRRLE
jgi:hypothetical protein